MKLNSNLKKQKEAFCLIRNTKMTDEEFLLLLINYPVYLAAISDNNLDNEEEQLIISHLSNFLVEIYGDELSESEYEYMIASYLLDFYWLSDNKEWERKILSALKELFKEVTGLKKKVTEMLNEINAITRSDNLEEGILASFLMLFLKSFASLLIFFFKFFDIFSAPPAILFLVLVPFLGANRTPNVTPANAPIAIEPTIFPVFFKLSILCLLKY